MTVTVRFARLPHRSRGSSRLTGLWTYAQVLIMFELGGRYEKETKGHRNPKVFAQVSDMCMGAHFKVPVCVCVRLFTNNPTVGNNST